jgi:hypothetical protein
MLILGSKFLMNGGRPPDATGLCGLSKRSGAQLRSCDQPLRRHQRSNFILMAPTKSWRRFAKLRHHPLEERGVWSCGLAADRTDEAGRGVCRRFEFWLPAVIDLRQFLNGERPGDSRIVYT